MWRYVGWTYGGPVNFRVESQFQGRSELGPRESSTNRLTQLTWQMNSRRHCACVGRIGVNMNGPVKGGSTIKTLLFHFCFCSTPIFSSAKFDLNIGGVLSKPPIPLAPS